MADSTLGAALDGLSKQLRAFAAHAKSQDFDDRKRGTGERFSADENWQRIGEILSRSMAAALDRSIGSPPGGPLAAKGARAPAVGAAGRPKTALGRARAWLGKRFGGRKRPPAAGGAGKPKPPAGGGKRAGFARKAGGWLAGSLAGRAVGAAVGGPIGAVVGGVVGGRIGSKVAEVAPKPPRLPGWPGFVDNLRKSAAGAVGEVARPVTDEVRKTGSQLGSIGGKLFAGDLVGAQKEVNKFTRETAEASQKLVELNRVTGAFSGAMAQIMAEVDAREAIRSREKGDRLSPSARYLAETDQDRKEGTKEGEVFWSRIDNYVGGVKNQIAQVLNWPVNKIYQQLNRFVEGQEKKVNGLGDAGIALAEKINKDLEEAEKKREELAKQKKV